MPKPPADHDYSSWVELLAIPHMAKQAYWHLVGHPDAVDAVRTGLAHDDPSVRAHCCRILDRLADEESFDLLVEMLADPDARTRLNAIHALACDRCKGDVCTPGKERVLPGVRKKAGWYAPGGTIYRKLADRAARRRPTPA